jgi:hypothetical protein
MIVALWSFIRELLHRLILGLHGKQADALLEVFLIRDAVDTGVAEKLTVNIALTLPADP